MGQVNVVAERKLDFVIPDPAEFFLTVAGVGGGETVQEIIISFLGQIQA